MSGTFDSARVVTLIRDVAAEEIMPRFRQLADEDVWNKQAGSVVTVADLASEARLDTGLSDLLSGSVVVGEEATEKDPAILERLAGEAPVWIIDPVDGTSNFAGGKPDFAVIVALSIAGETVGGWIHDPVNDITAFAERGGGAWLASGSAEKTRLDLNAACTAPADMRGSLSGRLRRETDIAENFAAVSNLRCCGAEYLALYRGELHFAHYRRLKPWDHLAGHLIHREAGGYNACLDATTYDPLAPAEGGLLMAPDRAVWENIAGLLRQALAALF